MSGPLLLVLTCLALARPVSGGEDLVPALVSGAIAFHDERSGHRLAAPDADDMAALLAGEIVVVRRRMQDGIESASAYALTTVPRDAVWDAGTHPDSSHMDDVTFVGIERAEDGTSLTFAYLDLPWPLDDRWWLAGLSLDSALARASDERMWARRWSLVDDADRRARSLAARGALGRFTTKDLEGSVSLPVNDGCFLAIDLDDRHTLVVHTARIVAGGLVPDGFMATFARRQLRGSLERILAEAKAERAGHARSAPRP